MFERFLHGQSETEQPAAAPKTAPRPAPARPAPAPKAVEPEAAEPAPTQEPLPEVRAEPMSDSMNPDARPPMAHRPIQAAELSSEIDADAEQGEEGFDEEEMSDENLDELSDEEAESEADSEEEEEGQEEAEIDEEDETELPADEDEEVDDRPEPPSFLKEEESKPEPEEDNSMIENSQYFVEEDAEEKKKKKVTIQPSIHAVKKDTHVVRGDSLHTVKFADIWFTPEGIAYVQDKSTYFALTPIETPDLKDFHRALEQGYTGMSSYAVKFAGDTYRVERVNTIDGLQYNCRKMPTITPEIETLGFATPIVKHLTSLGRAAGLLLFAGPTGQGKTTTASALMKRFLDKDGGFLYTIEDPPEMPLSGVYHAENGGLGLCKQVPVENDQWGAGLRSALRSRPRYILVGEIRTPETASQCLVAATSGHLVISTIHANGVEDALNSMIKYASSTGMAESLAADLLARGILGVVHQRLEGTEKLRLIYQTSFANPNTNAADQMRMTIRDKNINLATYMEQQKARMERGLPMFRE